MDKQYWTLRAIDALWDQDDEHGRYSRDYFRGLYSATRSDSRELSFRGQYQPKSVVVVLNVEGDGETPLGSNEEHLVEMLTILSEDIGTAFKIDPRGASNCRATVLNAEATNPQQAYEKVLNVELDDRNMFR